MSDKSPAYQRYSKDYLSSVRVQMMTLAEEGAYNRLLEYCWINGSIPSDPQKAARLVGKNCSVEIAETCLEMFTPHPEDSEKLIHDRLEVERKKQASNSEARRKAAEKRWNKDVKPEQNGKPGKSAEGRGTRGEADNTNGKQVKSKSNAIALQTDMQNDALHISTSIANANISSNEENIGWQAGARAREEPADLPEKVPKESQDDYLLRKQLEFPELDVQACFRKYLSFCREKKIQPKRMFFDDWLEKEEVPLKAADDTPDWLKAIENCGDCDEKGLKISDRRVCDHTKNV